MVARSYKGDVTAVARHLEWPEAKIQAAFNYTAAFPEEINRALAENDAVDFATIKRILPQAEVFVVGKAGSDE